MYYGTIKYHKIKNAACNYDKKPFCGSCLDESVNV